MSQEIDFNNVNKKFEEIYGTSAENFALELSQKHKELELFMEQEGFDNESFLKSSFVTNSQIASAKNLDVQSDVVTVQTFVWGYHLNIPQQPLQEILNAVSTGKSIASVVGTIIGGVAWLAGLPPIGLVIGIAIAFFTIELEVIKAVDQGNGVYLSWTWLNLQSFPVPTSR